MSTATAKEHPILFSTQMVQAILRDQKTVTRRVVVPQPVRDGELHGQLMWRWENRNLDAGYCHTGADALKRLILEHGCRYQVGDRLWVRETWQPIVSGIHAGKFAYLADDPGAQGEGFMPWRPSIHMPRAASRLTLEITRRRVEQLQDITDQEAEAEGCPGQYSPAYVSFGEIVGPDGIDPVDEFRQLWNEINGDRGYSWGSDPFVFVYDFMRVKP